MSEPQTNIEFITHFMEYGSALNQCMVIEAMSRYAESIVDHKEDLLKKKMAFVNPKALVAAAEQWLKEYKAFTESPIQTDAQREEIEWARIKHLRE